MATFILCNTGKKIKCKSINLKQEDSYYVLTAEIPLHYLSYFNDNRYPVSLNITRFFFFNKKLINFDAQLLPIYHVENNKLTLEVEVYL